MIKLVKYQNRNGDKVLLSEKCQPEIQDCGLLLKFPAPDNRKPSYAVLVDDDSLREVVDDLLVYLKNKEHVCVFTQPDINHCNICNRQL